MSNKIQNYVSIFGFLIAFCSLGYSWYTRNQDKTNENFEKEAQYRAETAKDIQEVKEGCKSSLQAQKNRFQEHLLNNPSGLSVTLFQEIGNGKQCVAIRGTNDPADIVTDVIDIAFLGTWERQAQYEPLNETAPANCRRYGF